MNLADIFALETHVLELILRGTVVYWALFLIFRISGRRNIGALGFADLVVVLLVASAVSDSLGAGATAVLDGIVVAASVVFWSAMIDRICYYFPVLDRLAEPSSVRLIENGRVIRNNMRQQYVTREELMEQLRLHGWAALPR